VDGIERVYSGRDALLTLIENSDVLAICLPGGSETRGLIGQRELSALGPSGLLINTGRGEIVRERDLVAALREGIIGGAALDVTSEEPLPASSPLWRCPNIIITPHIAGNVNNHVSEIQLDFIRRLREHENRR
jgi:phosphoglycerate dehydrogenase-like enzyme